ncbi:MAG TPA: MerR family transcriptional regulator [Actinomycetota bacterium]|nr:MerR family transcriptional regulator [Actinomycetota bacterium]
MEGRLIPAVEVARACRISYRQLDHWDRIGIARPHRAASGSGSRRGYRHEDAYRVYLVACLLRAGFSLSAAAAAAERIAARGELGTARLQAEDGAVVLVVDTQTLWDRLGRALHGR